MIGFGNFDVSEFWSGSEYERKEYVGVSLKKGLVSSVQRELGYILPKSYVELMRFQNGGIPRNTCYATKVATSWAEDHVAISGIYSIDRTPTYSLCGKFDNGFWNREWGYPQIGVYFANCPSGGHDLLCLDYRGLSSGEEPSVVHVDQEDNYRITPVAPDFESFIRGLTNEECFELD